MPATAAEVEVEWHTPASLLLETLELEAAAAALGKELSEGVTSPLEGMATLGAWIVRIIAIVEPSTEF